MTTSPSSIFLMAAFSLLALQISHATFFWPAIFLPKNQLTDLRGLPFTVITFCFSLAFKILFNLCHFIIVSVGLILFGTLCFLNLKVWWFFSGGEVFSCYFFDYFFCLFLFSFWCPVMQMFAWYCSRDPLTSSHSACVLSIHPALLINLLSCIRLLYLL